MTLFKMAFCQLKFQIHQQNIYSNFKLILHLQLPAVQACKLSRPVLRNIDYILLERRLIERRRSTNSIAEEKLLKSPVPWIRWRTKGVVNEPELKPSSLPGPEAGKAHCCSFFFFFFFFLFHVDDNEAPPVVNSLDDAGSHPTSPNWWWFFIWRRRRRLRPVDTLFNCYPGSCFRNGFEKWCKLLCDRKRVLHSFVTLRYRGHGNRSRVVLTRKLFESEWFEFQQTQRWLLLTGLYWCQVCKGHMHFSTKSVARKAC